MHRAPKRRYLRLYPQEQALRAARVAWRGPSIRARYQRRAEGERLMGEATRHGTRRAMAFGRDHAGLQAHGAVGAQNLRLIARRLAAQE